MDKHKPDDCGKPHECGVCDPPYYERNNYFYGKLLTVRDFLAEQTYFNDKRRLINRMVLGWGVVCGLNVRERHGQIEVGEGMAIDCCGREIVICQPWKKKLDFFKKKCGPRPEEPEAESEGYQGGQKQTHQDEALEGHSEQGQDQERKRHYHKEELVLCLKYDECETEEVKLKPIHCDEEEATRFNRVRDHFRIEAKRMEEACIPETSEDCCPLTDSKREHFKDCSYRTVHDYLCRELRGACPQCECDCLVLAKITVYFYRQEQGQDKPNQQHDRPYKVEVDPCWKRRLVYTNTLLSQLVDCYHGDLPHIYKVGWKSDIPLPFNDFKQMMHDGVVVYFDKPMKKETLNRRTFQVAVLTEDENTGYQERRLVPGASIEYSESEDGCSKAVFQASEGWITDTFTGRSRLGRHGGEVEIVLRGSSILGKCERALDGDFIAGKFPTGNGVQGGDFFCAFAVRARPPEGSSDTAQPDNAQSIDDF